MRITLLTALFLVFLSAFSSFADEDPPVFARAWGTPGSGPSQFGTSMSITVNWWGDVFIGDTDNNRVQVFSEAGDSFGEWGGAGSLAGQFDGLTGVTADAYDYVYAADHGNIRVQKFTTTGTYVTEWMTLGTAAGADVGSYVYVAVPQLNRIEVYDIAGSLFNVWGSFGTTPGKFDRPSSVAIDLDNYVYVADEGNHRIQKFYPTGGIATFWGEAGSGPGQFGSSLSVAVDPFGNVYVADGGNCRIQQFTSAGDYVSQWGTAGSGPGQFGTALAVATDQTGNILVADSQNSRVQVFYPPYREVFVQTTPIADVDITGPAAGTTPYLTGAYTGDTVTLTAPSTVIRSGITWYFVRWYLNAKPMTAGARTLTFQVGEAPTAIAAYKSVDYLKIFGHSYAWERSYVNFSCGAYFTDGSYKAVTTSAKWREIQACLRFVSPGRLWIGTVPRSARRSISASYGGVTKSFSILIRKRP